MDDVTLSVSDFVALLNQTLEFAYPNVTVVGELSNFRVSKNRWVYFDLKDELASVKFFGTVYQLPGPLEEGMTIQVRGMPRLHPLYGFSVTVQFMQPVGEGTIRRAAELLQAKLTAEGLFDPSRKRALPYAPVHIGLITSGESAAYADFIKIVNSRWAGMRIDLADVQVQGEAAVNQVIRAIEYFNQMAEPPEVLVITRGGGSADDLAAFSTEQIARAVAGSRIPTLAAIGHEIDLILAELAADQRASTPSNAAELLVPDKKQVHDHLLTKQDQMANALQNIITVRKSELRANRQQLEELIERTMTAKINDLAQRKTLLTAFSPAAALKRGYAIVRRGDELITSTEKLKASDVLALTFNDGQAEAKVVTIKTNKSNTLRSRS